MRSAVDGTSDYRPPPEGGTPGFQNADYLRPTLRWVAMVIASRSFSYACLCKAITTTSLVVSRCDPLLGLGGSDTGRGARPSGRGIPCPAREVIADAFRVNYTPSRSSETCAGWCGFCRQHPATDAGAQAKRSHAVDRATVRRARLPLRYRRPVTWNCVGRIFSQMGLLICGGGAIRAGSSRSVV
jgi:hypothetical protein